MDFIPTEKLFCENKYKKMVNILEIFLKIIFKTFQLMGLNISLEPEFVINSALWLLEQREVELGLSEEQQCLVREVRKRGRNKMHANNCRKKQMDQLADLQVTDLSSVDL